MRGLPLVVIIVLVLVTEIFPGAQRITHPPSLPEWAPVGEWIAENIPEEEIIAVAPVPMTDDRAEYEEIARWMYLQPALGRAMVNGYAPHRPKGHQAFAEAMRGFPSDEANVVLDERGARWLLTTSPILKSRIVSEGPKTGWARMFTYDDLGVVVHERITP